MIRISAHLGGPKASAAYRGIHVGLNRALAKCASGAYSKEVDDFDVLLCVSGNLRDFGGEGLERLARDTRRRAVGVDVVIPERVWISATPRARADHAVSQIRLAIEALLGRLARDGVEVNTALLRAELEGAFEEFLAAAGDPTAI